MLFNYLIKSSHLRVESQLQLLPKVLDWFTQFNILPLTEINWCNSQLALAEAFTNVVRHAHKHLPEQTPIDIECSLFQKDLILKIWDYGQPFNLKGKLQELQKNNLQCDCEAESGRGLILIQKTIDKISYKRGLDHRNCLILVKKISP